jgi:predicted RNA-binding Zn-ribbon protein involved in translation (DUF1610 family)
MSSVSGKGSGLVANTKREMMASLFVCPFCGSRKIRKEQEDDDDYCCDDCLEFFREPQILDEKQTSTKEETKVMKITIDKEKLKELHAAGKSDKEIAEALNAKVGTVWASRNSLGLKKNGTIKRTPKRSIDRPIPPPHKEITKTPKQISELTALDMLIAERNQKQADVFKLNQAIEILSA